MVDTLVTGGAGFIGSHIVDALLAAGHNVTVVDNRSRPGDDDPPRYLTDIEYVWADLNDYDLVRKLVSRSDVVVHQAARVGVGESMFAIRRYLTDNVGATASLLEAIAETGRVRRLVLASSMSVYGEGSYRCEVCGPVRPPERSLERCAARRWEQVCPTCGRDLLPVGIDEDTPLRPTSVYGVSKRGQEELCMVAGRAYGVATCCFRYFGVYGPRQLLGNPYTGIVAMFAARLVNGRPPLVFEDGRQIRDLIHVEDVASVVRAACADDGPEGVFNLGSGEPVTVDRVARILADVIDPTIEPERTGTYRKGDIRHCYSDQRRLLERTGLRAGIDLDDGLRRTAQWVMENPASESIDRMRDELSGRGLVI